MIPLFTAEKEAGLGEIIQAKSSLVYASLMEPVEEAAENLLKTRIQLAKGASGSHVNLHAFKSLLVSVGWNKNDDVFDRQEVWAARTTPEDQPINIEHDSSKIRGHITGQYPVNAKMERLADDLAIDELPEKYHLVTSAVLYKFYENEDIRDEMKQIIAELGDGKWYVSMECLLRGFDYAVADSKGNKHIVPRCEESAFLTKHLRAYGGDGKYQGYKIGRLLRNFSFSGKGIVRKPANPESIILAEASAFSAKPQEFSQIFSRSGYETPTASNPPEVIMPTEIELLKEQLKAANEEKAQALAALKEVDSEKLADLKNQLKSASEEVAAHKAKAGEMGSELSNTKAELDKTKAQLEETKAHLAKIEAEVTLAKRVSLLQEKLAMTAEEAQVQAALMTNLTDEAFAATSDYMAKKMAEFKGANKPKVDGQADRLEEENEEGEGHPKAPGLHTSPAKEPKKSAVKTVEVGGKPKQVSKENISEVGPKVTSSEKEVDQDANEQNASASVDEAQVDNDASLALAQEQTEKLESTRAAIWDFLQVGGYFKHAPKRPEGDK